MFHLVTNLVTEIVFPHSQMHKVAKKEHILSTLRVKLQGKFYHEYGIIVQIPDFQGDDDDEPQFSLPTVDDHHCSLTVRFTAICFKGTI